MAAGQILVNKKLLVDCLERMIDDFNQIDQEWGNPSTGFLKGAIEKGEVPEIVELSKVLNINPLTLER